MKKDNEVIIICSLSPGLTKGKETECVVCHEKIWLSDSSVADLQDRIILPYCLQHAVERLNKEKAEGITNPEILPITDRQRKEIKEHIDKDKWIKI